MPHFNNISSTSIEPRDNGSHPDIPINFLRTMAPVTKGRGKATLHASERSISAAPNLYLIGLWGYCQAWSNTSIWIHTRCSSPNIRFRFNFTAILPSKELSTSTSFLKAAELYHISSTWMKATFIIAFMTSSVVVSVGMMFGLTVHDAPKGSLVMGIIANVSFSFSTKAKGLTFRERWR